MKIHQHIEAVEKNIKANELVLADAARMSDTEREQFESRQSEAAQNLAPIVEAVAGLKNRLGALTKLRDEQIEELRIGRHQLNQQIPLAEEFERLVHSNFGHFHAEKNPGVFMELLINRPASLIAIEIVPRLKAWIKAKEEAIEKTELQIAELAQTAKPPAK